MRWSRPTSALLALGLGAAAQAQQVEMSFFVTSVGPGKGADLGGLEGADAHCQQLAEAAGAGGKTWRAYLSTQGRRRGAVNARDRIGHGPWHNAKGEEIADDVDDAARRRNNLTKQTALNEKGELVNGRGDKPNRHDILTGSQPDGTAFAAGEDRTCGNWTRAAPRARPWSATTTAWACATMRPAKSWNSSHPSRGGCSQEALRGTGGDGLFYCFAADEVTSGGGPGARPCPPHAN